MSLAIVHTRARLGIQAPVVTVEVHISNGLPALAIVGMAETAVKESRDRVRSAILNSQLEFPTRRITVNLAPADLPKEGGRYDLAIAVGILAASGQLPGVDLGVYEMVGELALSGELRACSGCLPTAMACLNDGRQLIMPAHNASEVALCQQPVGLAANSLLAVFAHLLGRQLLAPVEPAAIAAMAPESPLDLRDIKGQTHAKRALEIAASGAHHLLMSGPPGTGKTMLASRLITLLPPLSATEALEVACLYSISNAPDVHLDSYPPRPFRAPHHTASAPALVGGGSHPRPGEISLAHHGVLFLDELPEFQRAVLEVLREPLEHGQINISRAAAQLTFPCRFQLVAAMNPCPCGYAGYNAQRCRCTPDQVRRYRSKISGPLLDRIDLQVPVQALSGTDLYAPADGEDSASVRARVISCRERQYQRQGKLNNLLTPREIDTVCSLNEAQRQLLQKAVDRLGLSARSIHRLLKVARTLADMDALDNLQDRHLVEALSYRQPELLPT